MDFASVFAVFKSLILDWRLIVAFVAVLLYVNFIFYVARYRKKPKKPAKARIIRAAKPVEGEGAPAEGGEGATDDTEPKG